MESKNTNTHDSEFLKINGLTWLPWVGINYDKAESEHKLLIVGESHYYKESETPEMFMQNINLTTDVIYNFKIKKESESQKTLDNINRVLVKQNNNTTRRIWEYIAFYNFCQHIVCSGDRPSINNFKDSWKVFFEILKILKPKTCIFIGVEALNYFNSEIKNTSYDYSEIICENAKINNCYGRSGSIIINGDEILILGIRHGGKYFSWDLWNNFLKEKAPTPIEFLNTLKNEKI